jgi:hypothetical protein
LLITKTPSTPTAYMVGLTVFFGAYSGYSYHNLSHNSRTETAIEAILAQHRLNQAIAGQITK